ncbi:uncharacterized protein LOC119512160 [Choloepus didactylus]|uniref:uncharacterized protein LOC119512160 n=1 Tax=Choloepus didactylus TaxID=27675 RepID=UPI0018A0E8BC|nr:uncharacterized protein LOC119512160 [Choloepus didactylus]
MLAAAPLLAAESGRPPSAPLGQLDKPPAAQPGSGKAHSDRGASPTPPDVAASSDLSVASSLPNEASPRAAAARRGGTGLLLARPRFREGPGNGRGGREEVGPLHRVDVSGVQGVSDGWRLLVSLELKFQAGFAWPGEPAQARDGGPRGARLLTVLCTHALSLPRGETQLLELVGPRPRVSRFGSGRLSWQLPRVSPALKDSKAGHQVKSGLSVHPVETYETREALEGKGLGEVLCGTAGTCDNIFPWFMSLSHSRRLSEVHRGTHTLRSKLPAEVWA